MGRLKLPPEMVKSEIVAIRVTKVAKSKWNRFKGQFVGKNKDFRDSGELFEYLLYLFEKKKVPKLRFE